ncbi:MAG: helix-turn-helix transcriptional regulator [Burkholderiales bacterium]|nr:helix-turn-helix transcriptional regulator [Burkholderiales bacterium]
MLRWAREQAGLTQRQVATELGFHDSQPILRWEKKRGEPLANNLIKMCQACGFNVVLEPMSEEELGFEREAAAIPVAAP